MTGKKNMTWDPSKKGGKFPNKKNTALDDEYSKKVEKKADNESISESAVIRQCVEKTLK